MSRVGKIYNTWIQNDKNIKWQDWILAQLTNRLNRTTFPLRLSGHILIVWVILSTVGESWRNLSSGRPGPVQPLIGTSCYWEAVYNMQKNSSITATRGCDWHAREMLKILCEECGDCPFCVYQLCSELWVNYEESCKFYKSDLT